MNVSIRCSIASIDAKPSVCTLQIRCASTIRSVPMPDHQQQNLYGVCLNETDAPFLIALDPNGLASLDVAAEKADLFPFLASAFASKSDVILTGTVEEKSTSTLISPKIIGIKMRLR